jgi:low affinity Fe/Cu permease
MEINPILRLTFLTSIVIINFFSIILIINSLASLNKTSNDLKTNIHDEQVQSVNYQAATETAIDNEIRDNESLGNMERININNTTKANVVDTSKTNQNQAGGSGGSSQKALVGY